jgi:Glycosyltransferase family 87
LSVPRHPRWIAACVIPAIACAAWTIFAGKDLNWDLLHYHYYVAAALAEGRLAQDYFAASSQSYLNPLAYLPFYAMVHAGWHSVVVSIVLAVAHAANLTLLFVITRQLLPHRAARERDLLAVLGTLLGGATAVFWAMVGTSFVDILLTVPMLGGVALLLAGGSARAAWAGALFGCAAALKYSNAFFALAACVLALPSLAAYAAGGIAAAAVFAGPWLVHLYREFGNPLFPYYNAWFRSPDFLPINLSAGRYLPGGATDFLAFPLRMMSAETMTYAEIAAPDLRFAALGLLAVALPAAARLRAPGEARLGPRDAGFFAFFLLALAAWIATSANGRYGLLVLLLAGPCAVRLADRALAPRWVRVALGVLLVLQAAVCVTNSPARWSSVERWSRHWFSYVVPKVALERPVLYLTVETQAMSVIAPFLNPRSEFVNVRGQSAATPGWKRVVGSWAARGAAVRTIGTGLRLGADGLPRREVLAGYDGTLERFGWRVDPKDCFPIDWRIDDDDRLSRWANALAGEPPSLNRFFSLVSCALVPAERDPREAAAEQHISRIFDRIERECPRVFQGQSAVTDRFGAEWSRTYTGLDARLETHRGRAVLAPFYRLIYFDLGDLADWEKDAGPRPAYCSE